MRAAVTAKDLRFFRGRAATVDGMTFAVERGRVTALIGTNGAGKTTLMKLMLGLIAPASGELAVLDEAPGAAPLKVGYLPENVSFYDEMTVAEHLAFFAGVKGVPDARRDEVARRLRLEEIARQRPRDCSKGQRQRLGLAQALLADPELLILDEPTTGLDPQTVEALYAILTELAHAGCAVLLSTHELALAEKHVDAVMMVKAGKLIAGPATLADLRRQAGLPVRVVLRGGRPEGLVLPSGAVVSDAGYDAPEDVVPAIVTALVGAGCSDFDIVRPDLASLYAHFNEEAA